MTETLTAPPAAHVRIEEDATPIVRVVGRILRDAVRAGRQLPERLATVALRSHDTPQAATISLGGDGVEVTSGVLGEPDATIVVDLDARFAPVGAPEGDAELAADMLLALTPVVPEWRAAAEQFWNATRAIKGMPEMLVAVTEGPKGVEQHVLGEGEDRYVIAGEPETLAGVFSGADDLLAVLSAGVLGIQGTMSQLSVLVGASWKVRFDV